MIHGVADAALTDLSELSDRQLIGRFAANRDERAFAVLVSRHAPMVLRICRRIVKHEQDAEDACQAVFMLIARKAGNVRWHACIANWLYGAAVRISRNENRRLTRNLARRLEDAHSVASASDASPESAEIESLLYQELDRLPDKYRGPVVLCHLEGRSRRQTAAELGISETTVKGRLERALDMLRWKLQRRGLVVPAMLLGGELAREIAEAAISDSTALLTAQASAKFAAGHALAAASVNSVALAKGELAKMFLVTQIKWAVITIAVSGALGTGAILKSSLSSGGSGAATHTALAATGAGDKTQAQAAPAARTEQLPAPRPAPDTQLALADEDPQEVPADKEPEPLNGGAVTNGLKHLSLAMHNYHDANGAFPAAATYDANQKPLLSWRVHMLPYLGERDLYGKFRLREPWDSPHNKPLVEKMPAVFAAGSGTLQKAGKTVFLAPVGDGTAFDRREPIKISDITDGTSNTIMIVTVQPQYAVEWTKPAEWELDEKKPLDKLTGKDGEGFRFATCDGAAHNLAKVLSPEQLKAALTRAGGEIVSFD
ncbi:MAG TPA: sigma-70 family RNA polymerase sigma factor [Planctomycetaceae bacterium]|jgi:RNA polymerase sigma factor (sigma-70 family)